MALQDRQEIAKDAISLEALRTIDLLDDFPDSVLQNLHQTAPVIRLMDQEVLCEEGCLEQKMWVLLSGQLLVYKLKKTIDIIEPGNFLGEMSLIDQEPRAASVRSIGESTLIEIRGIFSKT